MRGYLSVDIRFHMDNGRWHYLLEKQAPIDCHTSSMEVEYIGATPAIQEILWLRDLLHELGIIRSSPTILNMDNQGAVSLAHGVGDSNQTKHIDIPHHFIHSHVEEKCVKVQYTLTDKMITDILTKNLACTKHNYFVTKLGMVPCLSGSVGNGYSVNSGTKSDTSCVH